MIISLIVAVSENNVIGINRGMPWHIPKDLKYFFKVTKGHHVVMGSRTFHEFGVSKPLPDRTNIIISRNTDLAIDGVIIKKSISEAIEFASLNGENELFIIGGGDVYSQTIQLADKLYITRIHTIIEKGDTFFPEIDNQFWMLVSEKRIQKDEENIFDFSFQVFVRK